jgi:hypothetical protein
MSNNTKANLIATGEFYFAKDAATAAEAQAAGFVDFGNIVKVGMSVDNEKQDHEGSYQGIKRIDKSVITKCQLNYKLTIDEIGAETLQLGLYGTLGTAFTQGSLATVDGTVLAFSGTPAVIGNWYDILDDSGIRVREITTVTIAGKTEGTDFVLDKKSGRIKFLTAQSADLTPVITAPAVTSSDTGYLRAIDPLSDTLKVGIGRVLLYDDTHPNKLVYDHADFGCQITVDSFGDFDGKNYTDMVLNVLVTNPTGEVFCAEA